MTGTYLHFVAMKRFSLPVAQMSCVRWDLWRKRILSSLAEMKNKIAFHISRLALGKHYQLHHTELVIKHSR